VSVQPAGLIVAIYLGSVDKRIPILCKFIMFRGILNKFQILRVFAGMRCWPLSCVPPSLDPSPLTMTAAPPPKLQNNTQESSGNVLSMTDDGLARRFQFQAEVISLADALFAADTRFLH